MERLAGRVHDALLASVPRAAVTAWPSASASPAAIIAEEAGKNGAELIVLSWNGSFESGHGAVIKELLVTAPCPLLLVPSALPEAV